MMKRKGSRSRSRPASRKISRSRPASRKRSQAAARKSSKSAGRKRSQSAARKRTPSQNRRRSNSKNISFNPEVHSTTVEDANLSLRQRKLAGLESVANMNDERFLQMAHKIQSDRKGRKSTRATTSSKPTRRSRSRKSSGK